MQFKTDTMTQRDLLANREHLVLQYKLVLMILGSIRAVAPNKGTGDGTGATKLSKGPRIYTYTQKNLQAEYIPYLTHIYDNYFSNI